MFRRNKDTGVAKTPPAPPAAPAAPALTPTAPRPPVEQAQALASSAQPEDPRPTAAQVSGQPPKTEPSRDSALRRMTDPNHPLAKHLQTPPAALGNPPPAQSAPPGDEGKLVVGRDIELSGEIGACRYLVVEGTVRATLREAETIEIAQGGLFEGTLDVAAAKIAGGFKGDLTVRKHLRLEAGSRVQGTVTYAELSVDSGAVIEGTLAPLTDKSDNNPTMPEAAPSLVDNAPEAAQTSAYSPELPKIGSFAGSE